MKSSFTALLFIFNEFQTMKSIFNCEDLFFILFLLNFDIQLQRSDLLMSIFFRLLNRSIILCELRKILSNYYQLASIHELQLASIHEYRQIATLHHTLLLQTLHCRLFSVCKTINRFQHTNYIKKIEWNIMKNKNIFLETS